MRCIFLMIRKTPLNKISANIKNRLHLPIAKVFQVRYLHHLTQNYAISRWLLGFIIALPHLINIWNHNFCFTFGTSYISVLVLLCYSSKSGGSSRKKRLDLYCLIPPPNGVVLLMEEIRRSQVEVGSLSTIIYRNLYIPGWWFGICEPSTRIITPAI